MASSIEQYVRRVALEEYFSRRTDLEGARTEGDCRFVRVHVEPATAREALAAAGGEARRAGGPNAIRRR